MHIVLGELLKCDITQLILLITRWLIMLHFYALLYIKSKYYVFFWQGNPILGVHIYLYSDDVLEVDCPQGSGNAPGQRKALCHAVSNADGMFMFKSIPCGNSLFGCRFSFQLLHFQYLHYLSFCKLFCFHLSAYSKLLHLFQMFEFLAGRYELIPFYKGENTVFDVSPPVASVIVEHQHVTVPQKFQVSYIVGYIVKPEHFLLLWYLFTTLLLYFLSHQIFVSMM